MRVKAIIAESIIDLMDSLNPDVLDSFTSSGTCRGANDPDYSCDYDEEELFELAKEQTIKDLERKGTGWFCLSEGRSDRLAPAIIKWLQSATLTEIVGIKGE
ncbi:MAG: hypothetical protein BWY78_00077 [Alphaproteobacteria bacterium ADurb.Bin438]|nr:MAG: hypothetical protein BWY78_00077 [Alphaproteobacteria bacterium ADurb.Bin438]